MPWVDMNCLMCCNFLVTVTNSVPLLTVVWVAQPVNRMLLTAVPD